MDEILTTFASGSDDCLPILSGKNIHERHGKDIPWKDKSGKTRLGKKKMKYDLTKDKGVQCGHF